MIYADGKNVKVMANNVEDILIELTYINKAVKEHLEKNSDFTDEDVEAAIELCGTLVFLSDDELNGLGELLKSLNGSVKN